MPAISPGGVQFAAADITVIGWAFSEDNPYSGAMFGYDRATGLPSIYLLTLGSSYNASSIQESLVVGLPADYTVISPPVWDKVEHKFGFFAWDSVLTQLDYLTLDETGTFAVVISQIGVDVVAGAPTLLATTWLNECDACEGAPAGASVALPANFAFGVACMDPVLGVVYVADYDDVTGTWGSGGQVGGIGALPRWLTYKTEEKKFFVSTVAGDIRVPIVGAFTIVDDMPPGFDSVNTDDGHLFVWRNRWYATTNTGIYVRDELGLGSTTGWKRKAAVPTGMTELSFDMLRGSIAVGSSALVLVVKEAVPATSKQSIYACFNSDNFSLQDINKYPTAADDRPTPGVNGLGIFMSSTLSGETVPGQNYYGSFTPDGLDGDRKVIVAGAVLDPHSKQQLAFAPIPINDQMEIPVDANLPEGTFNTGLADDLLLTSNAAKRLFTAGNMMTHKGGTTGAQSELVSASYKPSDATPDGSYTEIARYPDGMLPVASEAVRRFGALLNADGTFNLGQISGDYGNAWSAAFMAIAAAAGGATYNSVQVKNPCWCGCEFGLGITSVAGGFTVQVLLETPFGGSFGSFATLWSSPLYAVVAGANVFGAQIYPGGTNNFRLPPIFRISVVVSAAHEDINLDLGLYR